MESVAVGREENEICYRGGVEWSGVGCWERIGIGCCWEEAETAEGIGKDDCRQIGYQRKETEMCSDVLLPVASHTVLF